MLVIGRFYSLRTTAPVDPEVWRGESTWRWDTRRQRREMNPFADASNGEWLADRIALGASRTFFA